MIFGCQFDRVPVIFTSDLHHRALLKKKSARSDDFGVQVSLKMKNFDMVLQIPILMGEHKAFMNEASLSLTNVKLDDQHLSFYLGRVLVLAVGKSECTKMNPLYESWQLISASP